MEQETDLSIRLREVRKRMGLSQTAFGKIGRVSKGSQIAYETGRSEPSAAYLQRLAGAGVNVVYLLTGKQFVPPDDGDEFYNLLGTWLALGTRDRIEVVNFATWMMLRRRQYEPDDPDQSEARRRAAAYLDAVQRGDVPEYNPALAPPDDYVESVERKQRERAEKRERNKAKGGD